MKKKILIIGAGAVAAGIIGTVIAKVVKNHNKKYISQHKSEPEDYEDDFDYLEDDDDEIEEYLEEIIRDLEDRSAQLKKDVKVIAFEKKGE